MEDLGSLWTTYQESTDDLKQKLLYATLELESVKTVATDKIRKSEENVKNLLNLLKVTCKERDDARDQLQKIITKIMPSSPTEVPLNMFPHVQPESPLMIPTKANSSITESNSLSETYHHQSHGSSPVDSLFDAASSPEFSNFNVAESGHTAFSKQPSAQEFNAATPTGVVATSGMARSTTDRDSAVIDNYVKGKTLPQKGKLLETVMKAGPLLQTLLVAGPLPRWRNPPPLQPFKIPPVSIKGCETVNYNQKPVAHPNYVVHNQPLMMNSALYPEMSCGFVQTFSASMLNFNNASVSCHSNARLLSPSSSFEHQMAIGKRQRLQ